MRHQAHNTGPKQPQLDRCVELGITLSKIHRRLVAEGFTVKDGKVIPPQKNSGNVMLK